MTEGALGVPRLHLRVTASTNSRARELAIAGAPHGTLVTAAEQTAGRGRQGRSWSAPAGTCVLMSLITRSPAGAIGEAAPPASLAAAVAVARVVGEGARIKWPNDVLIGGRKVAGILVEGRPQEGWSVLGIGINVAVRIEELPQELQETAGTLGLRTADVEAVLAQLVEELADALGGSRADVLAEYRGRDALEGSAVAWSDGRGVAVGIDDEGRLRVIAQDGQELALDAGEVHLGSER